MTLHTRWATLVAMTTDQQSRPDTARELVGRMPVAAAARSDALRDVLTVAPGVMPFGIALGIVIATSAMGDGAGLLGAALVYGGSAQLPTLPHLALAGTALFVGMLMPRICDRPSVAAALTAGAVAPLAAQVVPTAGILAGTAAGMVAGLAAGRERSR
jgi:predicted branched-subunit amino acid permease